MVPKYICALTYCRFLEIKKTVEIFFKR